MNKTELEKKCKQWLLDSFLPTKTFVDGVEVCNESTLAAFVTEQVERQLPDRIRSAQDLWFESKQRDIDKAVMAERKRCLKTPFLYTKDDIDNAIIAERKRDVDMLMDAEQRGYLRGVEAVKVEKINRGTKHGWEWIDGHNSCVDALEAAKQKARGE